MNPVLQTLILSEAEQRQQSDRKREPWHAGWERAPKVTKAQGLTHEVRQFVAHRASVLLFPVKPVQEH